MAIKKRRKKKAVITRPGAGRKKELKRFELEKWSGGNASDDVLATNQIAFIVTTSGGTPLNTTDIGKLWRLLQHELRALGHKLKRKGQPLDPPAPKLKAVEPPPTNEQEMPKEQEPTEASSPDGDLVGAYAIPPKPQIADLADPDDPLVNP